MFSHRAVECSARFSTICVIGIRPAAVIIRRRHPSAASLSPFARTFLLVTCLARVLSSGVLRTFHRSRSIDHVVRVASGAGAPTLPVGRQE